MFLALSDFQDILREAARQFASKQAFAEAIGITPSRFSRVLAGTYTLNVLNCLRLAKVTGQPPSLVLRAAGKNEIADLIESQYGASATSVGPKEREILDLWNALTPRAREGLRVTMGELPKSGAQRPTPLRDERAPIRKRRRKAG